MAIGPEQTSIPEIAKAAGVPRASLYRFFPDKYALFERLAANHLAAVAETVQAACTRHAQASLDEFSRGLIAAASNYYARHPAAAILVLGGPWSPAAYRTQQAALQGIADAVRAALAQRAPDLKLPTRPDAICLMVEMAFACMKHGYFSEGRISPAVRREAVRAQLAYLGVLLEAAAGD